MIDTFSANSLKLLDKDPAAFNMKYKDGLFLNPDNKSAKAGQNLHGYLCFYLKGFDMEKIENSFGAKDLAFLDTIKDYDAIKTLKKAADDTDSLVQTYIEQPFLIKCTRESVSGGALDEFSPVNIFYLTGRFDAVLYCDNKNNDAANNATDTIKAPRVEIYDWKMVNIPENPESDIQSLVYLYSASKLYKSKNVSITYVSLTKNESVTVKFDPEFGYLSRISEIVRKLF